MLTVRWRPGDGPGDEAIGVRDALQLLEAPASDRGVWWLDVEDPTPEELDVVAGAAGTAPEHLAAQLAAGRSTLRVSRGRTTVLVPLTLDEGHGLRVGALAVIAGPAWIVTCSRPAPGVRDDLIAAVNARLASLDQPHGRDAITVVLDEAVDRIWEVSDDLDDRLAAAERTSLDDAVAAHRALQALRRDILALHRALGPLRRTLASLTEEPVAGLGLGSIHVAEVRQSHDAVVELRGQIDTQLLLLNGLSQTQMVAASHRANEVMQATSSWGAILVVATLITGVYGMNFRMMPELRWEFGYPFAIALIVASTVALYGLFKSRGWL